MAAAQTGEDRSQPDTFHEGHIHQFLPEPSYKIQQFPELINDIVTRNLNMTDGKEKKLI